MGTDGDRRPRVYLAGPDVFARDPGAVAAELQAVCAAAGLEGRFPLDPELEDTTPGAALGLRIAAANEAWIRACDGVLANLAPFRGPSADAGTVYEVGFARGLGKPIVGYTDTDEPLLERTVAWLERCGHAIARRPDGSLEDGDRMKLEQLGLPDNLMILGGIALAGGELVGPARAGAAGKTPVALAAEILARRLKQHSSGG